jgi:hypothetical protein
MQRNPKRFVRVRRFDMYRACQSDVGFPKHPIFTDVEEGTAAITRFTLLEVAVYLVIVGGITHFHPGISSRAQRGWFLSWALLGIIYGLGFINQLPPSEAGFTKVRVELVRIFAAMIIGAATIGGIVAMIQQYLHLFQCQGRYHLLNRPNCKSDASMPSVLSC